MQDASSSAEIGPRFASTNGHGDAVEDCSFNSKSETNFASVSRDGSLIIWDLRKKDLASRVQSAHNDDVNCVNWNALSENLVLTGGSDKAVKTWDVRKLEKSALNTVSLPSQVINVRWSPFHSNCFAASDDENWFSVFKEDQVIFQHLGHR